MMGRRTPLLLWLLGLLGLLPVAGARHGRLIIGSPAAISRKDPALRQVVLTAACSFNNQSNDAFLFRPSAIRRAQRQVVKGVLYIVDLEVSRTVCSKRDNNNNNNNNNNLSNCHFQPEGRLQQTFQCHSEVWVIPWRNESRTLGMDCKP